MYKQYLNIYVFSLFINILYNIMQFLVGRRVFKHTFRRKEYVIQNFVLYAVGHDTDNFICLQRQVSV